MRIELETSLKRLIKGVLKGIHTSIPAKVVSYDPATQTASVLPMVKRRVKNENTGEVYFTDPKPIPGVPVLHLSSGDNSFVFPVSKGTRVYLLYAESALSEWAASSNDEVQEPFDARKFAYSDAVALLGPQPPSQPLDASAYHEDHPVLSCGNFLIGSATASAALALAEVVSQELEIFKQLFNAHNHISNSPGEPSGPSLVQNTRTYSGIFDSKVHTDDGVSLDPFEPPPIPDTPEPEED